jgi:hypothetical protein
MLDKLQCSDFLPHVGQKFSVRLDGVAPTEMELASASELGAARQAGARRPFSLIFLGPAGSQYLLQGTYRLEHPQMEALDLFIVPLGPQQGRMRYEAIFT